ncbi:hypothetical protein [Acinetobacter sp. NS-4]|uniref:hypothetical protein n=1 Tax=Acinetobacter sp. NS-4 TaxID=3127956 RepID=UPI00307F44F7
MQLIIAQYQLKEKVICGISSCCTPHNYGYLVRLEDGNEIIIGNVCGKKYFGVEFTNQKKIIDVKRVEFENFQRLEETYKNLAEMKQKYESVVFGYNRKSFHVLNREIPKLLEHNEDISYWMMKLLKNELGTNGEIYETIYKTQNEIDLEKEIKANGANNYNGHHYISPTKQIIVDTLDGYDVVANWYKSRELYQYFDQILKLIKHPNEIANAKEVKKIIRELRGYDQNIIEFNDFCKRADILLKKDNLLKLLRIFNDPDHKAQLQKWANKF